MPSPPCQCQALRSSLAWSVTPPNRWHGVPSCQSQCPPSSSSEYTMVIAWLAPGSNGLLLMSSTNRSLCLFFICQHFNDMDSPAIKAECYATPLSLSSAPFSLAWKANREREWSCCLQGIVSLYIQMVICDIMAPYCDRLDSTSQIICFYCVGRKHLHCRLHLRGLGQLYGTSQTSRREHPTMSVQWWHHHISSVVM